jgi:hypothetical protein
MGQPDLAGEDGDIMFLFRNKNVNYFMGDI